MLISKINGNTRLKRFALFFFTAGLFSLAYTQSPLYTSNQNQYFLHGLAQAGKGFLIEDWLANTLDPTPVFSFLVYLTAQIFQAPEIYYVYYALIMGLYLFCLVRISETVYPMRDSLAQWALFIAILIVIHSASLRFIFSQLLGENWTYILEDGVADQRLLGPVFQPSTFGVLLLFSIYLFIQRHPYLAVLSAALAATIHPTYLLAAGALTLSYMIVSVQAGAGIGKSLRIGLLALLVVTPILLYVYANFANTPPDTTAQAQEILVKYRIPFHASISRWFDFTAVVKITLVIIALALIRKNILFKIMVVPFMVAIALTILQVVLESNALALIFPWRISVILVPLSTSLIVAYLLTKLYQRYYQSIARYNKQILITSGILIILVVIGGTIRWIMDLQRQASAPDRAVMRYVIEHNAPEEVYLVPLAMQDFRLVTGSPVYAEFKSIPYRDIDVLEWAERIRQIDNFYKRGNCGWLDKWARLGITHLILTRKQIQLECPDWSELYRDDRYGVYRIE